MIRTSIGLMSWIGLLTIGTILATVPWLIASEPQQSVTWRKLAPLPDARQEMPAVHFDGRVYVAGGMDSGSCCNAVDYFTALDLKSNQWHKLAPLPLAVNHPGLAALDGKIYVLSGYTGGKYADQPVTPRCFAYDIKTNDWAEIASLPQPAAAPGVVTWNGKIYLFGGDPNPRFDNAGNATVHEYDPAKNRWRLVNDKMPHGRMHIGAGRIDHMVYLSPGRPGAKGRMKDDLVQAFDLNKMDQGERAWRMMNPLPQPHRTGYIANWPVVGDELWYIGGESGGAMSDVHIFKPDATGGTWRKGPAYPTPIHGIGPAVSGRTIIVVGGASGGGVNDKTDAVYAIDVPE